MARNDVYLNINSLSPADAVVTGQQDMTAATIPELVLGDTPTFNFYFTDNTNVWPSWAGNAAYTLTWALSDAVAGDFAPAATTGNATPITGGWSVVLPLNSYDLVGLLNTKRVGQPYPVQNLWQQLRVTDPSGNEITRAMVWTPVRYRAISDTQNTESASPTGGRFVTVNNVNELTTPTDAQFYAANPVPTSALGTASNGQLFIGNGTGFTKATLTAGTGVAITNGSGSITIDATNAQELLTATVTNAEATPITKGQVVYIFGATGNRPSVKLAYNTGDATSAKTFGVVSDASIAAGGTGTVTCVGVVDGLNLGTYSDGDTVYLGATPGSITATKPYAPNHLVYVGIIERANAGNGELYVRIQNGYELDEIHDVQILTPPAAGSLLIRDNTLSLWKAATLTAGTNIAVTNGDAAVTVGLTGTVAVANGGTGVTTSTGTGSVVLSTSPSLTTPSLGAASATSINGTSIPSSKTLVVTTDKLSALAATTSSELAGVISDETGTGALVFANTPTLVTPNIGAATGTSFNLTGSGTLGTTLTVSGTTDSSSKDTGAIVTEGGLGVEKSATIGGNLTVSGTGTSSVGGKWLVGTGGVDSGALLQVGTNTTTSAGGMVFGTNTFLYRTGAGSLAINGGVVDPVFRFYNGATQYGYLQMANSYTDLNAQGGTLYLKTSNSIALTLDSSQNATFAGNVTVSGADKNVVISSTAESPALLWTATGGNAANRNWKAVINNSENGDWGLYQSTTAGGAASTKRFSFNQSGDATFAGKITANGAGSTFKGTSTNDDAAAGYVGEIITSTVESGSAVSLTSAALANITSISLTAGDWDVSGVVGYSLSGATVQSFLNAMNNASAALGPTGSFTKNLVSLTTITDSALLPTPVYRFTLTSTSTVYLIGRANFTAGTVSGYGHIRARRVR